MLNSSKTAMQYESTWEGQRFQRSQSWRWMSTQQCTNYLSQEPEPSASSATSVFSSLLETMSGWHLPELVAQEKKMFLDPAFLRIYTGLQPTGGVENDGRDVTDLTGELFSVTLQGPPRQTHFGVRQATILVALCFRGAAQEQHQEPQQGNQDHALAAAANHSFSTHTAVLQRVPGCLSCQPCRTSTCL